MKVNEVPQDSRIYVNTLFNDINYAVDDEGNYVPVYSEGWKVKNDALDVALEEANERCEEVRKQVLAGELSPLAYHIEKNIMDLGLLAKYTGIWKITIKKHLKPEKFKELDDKVLLKYAEALRITVEELKTV